MEEEDSILQEFLVECSEGIDRLDQEFVALEKSPGDSGLLASIFRTVHTIKGTCGFLGLPKLENIAHGTENILSVMRDGKMPVTPEGVTILLEAIDTIKDILGHIEEGGTEPDEDFGPLRKRLDDFLAEGLKQKPAKKEKPAKAKRKTKKEKKDSVDRDGLDALKEADALLEAIAKEAGPDHADTPEAKEKVETPPEISSERVASQEAAQTNPTKISPEPEKVKESPAAKKEAVKRPSITDSTVRVDVGLLDRLINLVGELVLARNQLLQVVRKRNDSSEAGTAQQLNLITTELQDTVMKTRMQPIKNVWDKLPRVVRDLSRSNGKKVELVMEGAGTELDKSLLESIKDPLTHIVRNSIDHGIETPEERLKNGKSEGGTLLLRAFHEGGQINIEIKDDGKGIDVETVKRKAVEKGHISREVAEKLSDREGLALIFRAGLSTAKKVTNVSGRGVGMDVVKTNIEKIGGEVEMMSMPGEGTTLRIKIPLTLAIVPASIVVSDRELFAIPQASLLEFVRIDHESGDSIETIQGSDFYRLRGNLLPLVSLRRVLKMEEKVKQEGSEEDQETNIVILKAREKVFGLIVDDISDSEEIVVKPLSRQLKGIPVLSGATIMGDGHVALILDVVGLAQEGGVYNADVIEGESVHHEDQVESTEGERKSVVIFSISEKDQYAVLLSQVARLEEFDPGKFEHSGGREVVQYRGGLLPLVRLGDMLGIETVFSNDENNGRCPVIVFSKGDKNVGLIVGCISDALETKMNLFPTPSGRTEVTGSLVIDGHTTDLLDIDQIIDRVEPGWLEATVDQEAVLLAK
ncbi:MAG: chemotaxis protein CheA [Nitrospiria bacterium]